MPSKLEHEILKVRGEVSESGKIYTGSIASLKDSLTEAEEDIKNLQTSGSTVQSRINNIAAKTNTALSSALASLKRTGDKLSGVLDMAGNILSGVYVVRAEHTTGISFQDTNKATKVKICSTSHAIQTDTISEDTGGTGVTIDGVKLKDNAISTIKLPTSTELTLAADTITVTQSYHTVDTQDNAATDNLGTINGGTEGMILYLRAEDSARTIVVQHGMGNILCGGADKSLDVALDIIVLVYMDSWWLMTAFQSHA